jgi:hypothetical protein
VPGTQSLSNRSLARNSAAIVPRGTWTQPTGSYRSMFGTSVLVGGDIGNYAFVEGNFLNLAWHLTQID